MQLSTAMNSRLVSNRHANCLLQGDPTLGNTQMPKEVSKECHSRVWMLSSRKQGDMHGVWAADPGDPCGQQDFFKGKARKSMPALEEVRIQNTEAGALVKNGNPGGKWGTG